MRAAESFILFFLPPISSLSAAYLTIESDFCIWIRLHVSHTAPLGFYGFDPNFNGLFALILFFVSSSVKGVMLTLILGVTYILEKLPDGYGLFDRPRGSNPSGVSFVYLCFQGVLLI